MSLLEIISKLLTVSNNIQLCDEIRMLLTATYTKKMFINNDKRVITLEYRRNSANVNLSGKMLSALAVNMRVVYARKYKKLIFRNNVSYSRRGNGAARTIVNIPDRLIRK